MHKSCAGAAVAALGFLLFGNFALAENERNWKAGIPGSKMAIETPLKRLISTSAPSSDQYALLTKRYEKYRQNISGVVPLNDPGKSFLLDSKSASDLISSHNNARTVDLSAKYGRKVQPGKVNWRSDIAEAALASKHSGKPLLVFQMMGRLDQEFC